MEGGYKQYRRWVLEQFELPRNLIILGGKTGSGKTKILQHLRSTGEQVIDLEDLAQHQGSSYGTLNKLVQPSQEQFENELAACLVTTDAEKPTWMEDESITIGKRFIPKGLWEQMRNVPIFNIKVPLESRIAFLVEEYGQLDKEFLVECTTRIGKRLGPEQTKNAVTAINEGRMADFIRQVLVYYDKTYQTGLSKRSPEKVYTLDGLGGDANENAELILASLPQFLGAQMNIQ